MQAYWQDSQQLLSCLTGRNFKNAELVKIDINNAARRYTGDPDSAFIDLKSRNIALIEIKIGNLKTKYSLGQSIKYETMSALLRSEDFFPGFKVEKILLGPSDKFSENTMKPHQLGASSDSEGVISFSYEKSALASLKPTGFTNASSLIAGRLAKLTKSAVGVPDSVGDPGIQFFSWQSVGRCCPPGLLRENITALMKFLAPKTSP